MMNINLIRNDKNKYERLPIQVKASFWFLICSFLQKGISTITTPIFTRLLTPEEYGNYSVFNSWLSIVAIIITLNIFYGVYTQGLVKFEQEKTVFSSSLQGLMTTMASLWLVIYFIGREFWNSVFSLTTVQMLCMFVMVWSSAVFNFWSAEQRVEYKYKTLVFVTLLVSLAKPIIGIVFVLLSTDKVTARILGLALVELVGYSWCFFAQIRHGKQYFSKRYWTYAICFCLPLLPHYLSQMILNNSDRIMIRNMVGSDAAGIYSLAYSISQIMILFNNALSQTISPWMYKKIKAKDVGQISTVAYLSIGIVAALNLLLILIAPEAVKLFAPESYYESIWVIPPVAMSVVLIYSYDFFARFEFYYEKTRFIMIASVCGAILNVVLNYFFIDLFGYRAAGYTTLICYLVYVICHFCNMNRICKSEFQGFEMYNWKILVGMLIVFLLLGFTLMATYNYPVIRYSVLAIVAVFVVIKREVLIKKIQMLFKLNKDK